MCFWRGRSTPAIRAIAVVSLLAPGLALALLVFRVDADHPHHAFAVDDLALITNLFYRCSYFHNGSQFPGSHNLREQAPRPFGTLPIYIDTRFGRDSDRREKAQPPPCPQEECV